MIRRSRIKKFQASNVRMVFKGKPSEEKFAKTLPWYNKHFFTFSEINASFKARPLHAG